MVAVPDFPSLVAVIVAVPAAAAVIKPVELTVAFVASDVVHAMVRPVSVAPFALSVVAFSCRVLPTITVAADGATASLFVGGTQQLTATTLDATGATLT